MKTFLFILSALLIALAVLINTDIELTAVQGLVIAAMAAAPAFGAMAIYVQEHNEKYHA